MKSFFLTIFLAFFLASACSPLKSTSKEEKHQLELTLHELQTNLDDSRHDLHCFQAEAQILEGRVKQQETSLATFKQQYYDQQQVKIDSLIQQLHALEKKNKESEERLKQVLADLRHLQDHANESTVALSQYKNRLNEFEKDLLAQNRRFDELGKLKSNIDTIVQSLKTSSYEISYKVKAGDSLEKIAKNQNSSIEAIKKANRLENDTIYAGQELKVPVYR